MTNLEINIALAQALGWTPAGTFGLKHNHFGVFNGIVLCNANGLLRKFDYCDPLIFVAICKRWGLFVTHSEKCVMASLPIENSKKYLARTPEYAAAWCVIDSVNKECKPQITTP